LRASIGHVRSISMRYNNAFLCFNCAVDEERKKKDCFSSFSFFHQLYNKESTTGQLLPSLTDVDSMSSMKVRSSLYKSMISKYIDLPFYYLHINR